MCMRHKYIIDHRCIDRNLLICVQIRPLFHTTVHQYMLISKG